MLVRFKDNVTYDSDWALAQALIPGALYVVAAIEYGNDRLALYVDIGSVNTFEQHVPFGFDVNDFEVIDGEIPSEWSLKYINEYGYYIMSYPEWLEPMYALQAHDFDLAGEEAAIFLERVRAYESKYSELLSKNREELGLPKHLRNE